MSGEINWGEPIEVVSDSGRICEALLKRSSSAGGRKVFWETTQSAYAHSFFDNGLPHPGLSSWEVRNAPQSNSKPHLAPSGGEVGPEVVLTAEQASVLRKTLAGIGACVGTTLGHQTVFVPAHLVAEAREALSLLPEPVDADERQAINVLAECGWIDSDDNYDAAKELALAGIQRGRSLEKGEAS